MKRLGLSAGVLLLAAGCTRLPPPERIAIDPTFSAEQRETIEGAIEQWCAAVGWCPEIVDTAEPGGGTGIVSNGYAPWSYDGRPPNSAGYIGSDGRVYINTEREVIRRPEVFAFVVLHELGHYAINNQHGGKLMAERGRAEEMPRPCIDLESAELWCKHWHCPEGPTSTCGGES